MIQRSLRDVYALSMPEFQIEGDFEAGDEIDVTQRTSRLLEHGWIEETDDGYELTEHGASILNYLADRVNKGKFDIEQGAGSLVDSAITTFGHTFTQWEVVKRGPDEIVMEAECETCDMTQRKSFDPSDLIGEEVDEGTTAAD